MWLQGLMAELQELSQQQKLRFILQIKKNKSICIT